VRHAQSEAKPGIPASRWGLSVQGRESCLPFVEGLKPYLPFHIVSSIEPKTWQTAEIIGAHFGLPVQAFPGLHEHRRETLPFLASKADFESLVVKLFECPNDMVMGEETASQALVRFDDAIKGVLEKFPQGNLLISSHGTVLALFAAKYNDLDPVRFWKAIKMPDYFLLQIPTFKLLPKN